jgi:hypothetical protein
VATILEIARSSLAAVNTDANVLLAARWVNDRFRQLASRARLRSLRQVGSLVLPAPVTAGVATITRGSKFVTGDATAQAAWSTALEGQHFKARVVWYQITKVQGNQLELENPFAEDDVADGSYRVVQRYTPLDETARWLGDFVHMRRRMPIDRVSLPELNIYAPERQHVGVGPYVYVETTSAASGAKRVELYPYPSLTEFISYVFWSVPANMGPHDHVPVTIDPYMLKEGTLIDIMRYEMAKAANAGRENMAAFWRNEYRAQSTTWEKTMLEAIRADRGSDDMTFILERHGLRPAGDIRTARDYVLANWPR